MARVGVESASANRDCTEAPPSAGGDAAWRTEYPCEKVVLRLHLADRYFVQNVSLTNWDASHVELRGGDKPDVMWKDARPLLPKTEVRSMWAHKAGRGGDEALAAACSGGAAPLSFSCVLVAVYGQWEPQGRVGLRRLQLDGAVDAAPEDHPSWQSPRAAGPKVKNPHLQRTPPPKLPPKPKLPVPVVAAPSPPVPAAPAPVALPADDGTETESDSEAAEAPPLTVPVPEAPKPKLPVPVVPAPPAAAGAGDAGTETESESEHGAAPHPPGGGCDDGDAGTETESESESALSEPPAKKHKALLGGVTVCLSGFINLERGVLRETAVRLGASVVDEWGASATHLVAAYLNTPKHKAAVASGHAQVVTKDWLYTADAEKTRPPEGDYPVPEAAAPPKKKKKKKKA
eukprot:TRINITY_DN2653_c1_g1_i1.p1 TRINITY_DN2653_c1_g1~~TRINITY_DN2653_c1_g1_i1.p1  ORF type:complete len:443 (+),score=112.56 TRINITY_DN2653_c1_g1_i1:122-1330(+)